MQYLSKEIEARAKRKKLVEKSLIKKQYSCGIFQDYGAVDSTDLKIEGKVISHDE